MNVDKNHLRLNLLQKLVGGAERVVVRCHKHAPLQVDHCIWNLSFYSFVNARAGHVRGIIRRTQHAARRAVPVAFDQLKVVNDFALVPDVVPGGDYVNVEFKKLFRQRWSNSKTSGGILPIRDDQIDLVIANNPRQPIFNNIPPWSPEDIANEEYSHELCRNLMVPRMRWDSPWTSVQRRSHVWEKLADTDLR